MDALHSITLAGPEAQAERQRLLADGKEVNLVCRRRDSKGKDVSKILFFGRSPESSWVAVQSFKNREDIGIEITFPDQAQMLFAAHVDRVMMAKMLTNSDPLSPEWFDLNPDINDLAKDLRAEFDVEISPWG